MNEYVWVLGKKEDQLKMRELVQPLLQEGHKLEALLQLEE